MASVEYTVDLLDGVWTIGLGEKRFGPYSSMETATTAAMGAARKAEAQGYEASVTINHGPDDEAAMDAPSDAQDAA